MLNYYKFEIINLLLFVIVFIFDCIWYIFKIRNIKVEINKELFNYVIIEGSNLNWKYNLRMMFI